MYHHIISYQQNVVCEDCLLYLILICSHNLATHKYMPLTTQSDNLTLFFIFSLLFFIIIIIILFVVFFARFLIWCFNRIWNICVLSNIMWEQYQLLGVQMTHICKLVKTGEPLKTNLSDEWILRQNAILFVNHY